MVIEDSDPATDDSPSEPSFDSEPTVSTLAWYFDRPGCQSAHSPCPSLPDPGAKTSRERLN